MVRRAVLFVGSQPRPDGPMSVVIEKEVLYALAVAVTSGALAFMTANVMLSEEQYERMFRDSLKRVAEDPEKPARMAGFDPSEFLIRKLTELGVEVR